MSASPRVLGTCVCAVERARRHTESGGLTRLLHDPVPLDCLVPHGPGSVPDANLAGPTSSTARCFGWYHNQYRILLCLVPQCPASVPDTALPSTSLPQLGHADVAKSNATYHLHNKYGFSYWYRVLRDHGVHLLAPKWHSVGQLGGEVVRVS
eukprot:1777497-Rhodomonas_salina.3